MPEGNALLRAFASKVMYFELLYATPYSTTWSQDELPRRGSPSGPLSYWDSTRSLEPSRKPDPKLFSTYIDKSSRADARDDILPPRVKVTLVVREGEAAESSTTLLKDLGIGSTELTVTEPDRVPPGGFVYMDGEWIETESVSGAIVRVKNRGARGTKAGTHGVGAEVAIGRTFEATITLPAAREDWGDR